MPLPSWFSFIPLSEPLQYAVGRRALRRMEESGTLFTVLTSRDLKPVPKLYNSYYAALYQMFDPENPYLYLSSEIHATEHSITEHIWTPKDLVDFTGKLIQSLDVAAEVMETPVDYLDPKKYRARHIRGAVLNLSEHFLFPLLQSKGEKYTTDAMTTLCAALSHIKEDDELVIQFLLRPVSAYTVKLGRMAYDNYEKFGSRPLAPEGLFRTVKSATRSTMLPLYALYHGALAPIGANMAKLRPKEDKDALEKVNEGQFFDVCVRVISAATDPLRCKENLTTVLSSFAPMQGRNRWKAERRVNRPPRYRVPFTDFYLYRHEKARDLLQEMAHRRLPVFPRENYLAPSELSSVVHYPDASVPFVKRLQSKKLPVPDGVLTYNSIESAWEDRAVVIGCSDYRGRLKYIGIKDRAMLSRHLYLIGTTGSGKTTLLQFIAAQVVRLWGYGLVYYDVKGDAVDKLMQYIPEEKLLYIDLSNQVDPDMKRRKGKVFAEHYIPFNILRAPQMTDYALAELIVGVFVRVFGASNIMFKSQNYLRKAIIAVLSTDPEGTILEVYRMFTDSEYLDRTIDALEHSGHYPDVLAFWRNVYREMSPKGRYNEVQAILNKLEAITTQEKPRYTMCQRENMLPWREIIDGQKVVLVNLAQGSNTDEGQRFFGTLITSLIKRAAWSREDTPETARPPVLFILDEFEKFAGNAEDIEELLALARSYGLCLLMAHQDAEQVPSQLLNQVLGLTSTNICLNVGEPSAARLYKSFPGLDSQDLTGLVPYQGAIRMKVQSNQTFTFSTVAVEKYLETINEDIRGTKKRQYARYYRHIQDIETEILGRYKLVEANQETEPETHVKKGQTRKRLQKKGAPASGETTKTEVVEVQEAKRRGRRDAPAGPASISKAHKA